MAPMDDLAGRVSRLERLVDDLYSRLGARAPETPLEEFAPGFQDMGFGAGPSVSTEVRELTLQGKQIQAIKLYREQTGCDLRTAKDVIDGLR